MIPLMQQGLGVPHYYSAPLHMEAWLLDAPGQYVRFLAGSQLDGAAAAWVIGTVERGLRVKSPDGPYLICWDFGAIGGHTTEGRQALVEHGRKLRARREMGDVLIVMPGDAHPLARMAVSAGLLVFRTMGHSINTVDSIEAELLARGIGAMRGGK
mgnify:CR=1 FL=1